MLKNKETKNVVIICSPEMAENVEIYDRRKQVTTLFEYPADIN